MVITTYAVNSGMLYSSRETPPLGLQTITNTELNLDQRRDMSSDATVIEYGLIAAVIAKENSD
ncbi:hypothetical protein OAE71_02445 [Synechococcus sp. AH-551-A21]|nr:hypothetical protein [Synechococcus sp. AH-551-A21]MDB4678000.1 hypothetical protein [Synechococcus sp. AH-551-A21]